MYICVTTPPKPRNRFCIKIIPANRASYADCYRLLRFEIFTPTIFITPKNISGGPVMLNQWEQWEIHVEDSCKAHSKSIGKYSRFMAQMTWFSPRMVLFGVRTMSDIIWGKCTPKTPKRDVNRHFQDKLA